VEKDNQFLKELNELTVKNRQAIFFVVSSSNRKSSIDLISFNKLNCCFEFSEIKGVELAIEGIRLFDKKVNIFVVFDALTSLTLEAFSSKALNYDKKDKNLKIIFI
jgi:hypothetical protein